MAEMSVYQEMVVRKERYPVYPEETKMVPFWLSNKAGSSLLVLILILLAALPAPGQIPVAVDSVRGRATLEGVRLEGEVYIPVLQLVERTDLDFDWDPVLRRFVLKQGGLDKVVCLVDNGLYRVDGRYIQHPLEPKMYDGRLYLPLTTLKEVLGPALFLSFPVVATPTMTPAPLPTPTLRPTPIARPVLVPTFVGPEIPILPQESPVPIPFYPEEPVTEEAPPEERTIVVIDPARGGTDPGYITPDGFREADYIYDLAILLKRRLEESLSVVVVLTREQYSENEISSEERAIRANSAGGDLLISLRMGQGFNPSSQGFSVFYMTEIADDREPFSFDAQGRPQGGWDMVAGSDWQTAYLPHVLESGRLAKLVSKYLVQEIRGRDRGVRPGRLALLRSVQMPAVWVELGVLSNAEDLQRLRDVEQQQRIIQALSLAVQEYLQGLPGASMPPTYPFDRTRP